METKKKFTYKFAGYVCRKCGKGNNHDMDEVRLPGNQEEIQKKRYGRRICDECKLKILDNDMKLDLNVPKSECCNYPIEENSDGDYSVLLCSHCKKNIHLTQQ